MYGYITPKGPNVWRLGAFANTKLKQLKIPISVTKIGNSAFDNSKIEEITIAPDCYYGEHTFPKDCKINYWSVNSFELISPPDKRVYYLNESKLNLDGLELKASMSDNKNTIEREVKFGYNISGFDSKIQGNKRIDLNLGDKTIDFNIEVLPYDETKIEYWQSVEDASESMSLVAYPKTDCILLVAAMHRDEVVIEGDGWQQLIVSKGATYSGSTYNQNMTLWYKRVSAGEYNITVNQNSSIRMGIKAFSLYDVNNLEVIENELIPSTSYTPIQKNNKRRLYFISSIYANTNDDSKAFTISNNLQLTPILEGQRFISYYDYQPETNQIPIFTYWSSSYTPDSANILVIDIN